MKTTYGVGAFEPTSVQNIYKRHRAVGKPTFYVRYTDAEINRAGSC